MAIAFEGRLSVFASLIEEVLHVWTIESTQAAELKGTDVGAASMPNVMLLNFLRVNPDKLIKLVVLRVYGTIAFVAYPEDDLFLSDNIVGEIRVTSLITVSDFLAAFRYDVLITYLQADLFHDLTLYRITGSLTVVEATLWKFVAAVPRRGTDQYLVLVIHQDSHHALPVAFTHESW